jgi:hypothetical protein
MAPSPRTENRQPRETDDPSVLPLTLGERLRLFMQRYNLTRRGMCEVLQCPESTFNDYVDLRTTPPAVLAPLLTLLEEHYQVRTWLGVNEQSRRPLPRGKPWPKGNPYCYGSSTRNAALKEARARKRAAE